MDALLRENRLEDALEACDDVRRRFGASGNPDVLRLASKAALNRGVLLHRLGRSADAVVAFEELVVHFEESGPAVLESVAMALFDQGTVLARLNRPEEAVRVYETVVQRFGESDDPALLKPVAMALVNLGGVLRKRMAGRGRGGLRRGCGSLRR